jgi:hypothetical protein
MGKRPHRTHRVTVNHGSTYTFSHVCRWDKAAFCLNHILVRATENPATSVLAAGWVTGSLRDEKGTYAIASGRMFWFRWKRFWGS